MIFWKKDFKKCCWKNVVAALSKNIYDEIVSVCVFAGGKRRNRESYS